jgi:murein L,D-transpeptidase YafK
VLLLAACAWLEPAPAPTPAPGLPEPPVVGPPEVDLEPPPCERVERIVVHKSERRLVAECEGGARVEFTAALGREPEGPKLRAGDERTPEGEYRIAGPAQPSRFYLFIPIDYPSRADAIRALQRGVLSPTAYAAVVRGIRRGEPPQGSPLGGGLGLHGEGERWRGDSELLDWTNGCVAVKDDHIEFLAEHAPIGTPVLLLP